ncbi:GDSL-type esterase/lipase family protein [Paenarthrobacter histidinolovorans]|uniref:GDSL-type esterase/lipase family protein n=1 Tax=Paenarthrobacter histidinolovorans TaxID=43664 RepID=UPI00166686AF|nr:GDSL-type esterase/lipase family protein [Paenarthrobacter histidinolovorans]
MSGWMAGTKRAVAGRVSSIFDPMMRPQQEHRRSQFAALGAEPGRIVFLGDSISEGGLWEEWFPTVEVLNRGIGGETSAQVLDRLDTAINEPRAVFLLIGTNDLTRGLTIDVIERNVRSILQCIRQRSPECTVFVQSVMPRTAARKEELQELNQRLLELCRAATPSTRFIDLWPVLATSEGTLNPHFSEDNLHLNGDGYRAWVDLIRPLVLEPSNQPSAGFTH